MKEKTEEELFTRWQIQDFNLITDVLFCDATRDDHNIATWNFTQK